MVLDGGDVGDAADPGLPRDSPGVVHMAVPEYKPESEGGGLQTFITGVGHHRFQVTLLGLGEREGGLSMKMWNNLVWIKSSNFLIVFPAY